MVSIGFCGVTLRRGGKPLLERAHLSIGPSELVLITGPRGAGKSLLLAAAAGIVEPDEGTVLIAGRQLSALQASARPYVRRNIGYLPPDPPFVREETALENVMMGLGVRGFAPGEAELLARRTLAQIGAEELGTDHRPVHDLSIGERRLVAVARALAGPPPIVVLDEPSAGLDRVDRDRLAEAMALARAGGASILCASNDGALGEALRAAGARRLTLNHGHLEGDQALIRLVDDDPRDGKGDRGEGGGSGRGGAAGERGGVVISFPTRPAREVS
jgi:ABC-type multidrug transport system ATPase subunit